MMTSARELAKAFGCPVVDRIAEDSFYWDGSSIAGLFGPTVPLADSDLLHELSHWIVATEAERALPEYGMVCRPVAICQACDPSRRAGYEARVQTSLTKQERHIRENAAQLVNRALGKLYSIKSVFARVGLGDWDSKTMSRVTLSWEVTGSAYLLQRGISLEEMVSQPPFTKPPNLV